MMKDVGKRRRIGDHVAALITVLVIFGGCSVGVQTYEEFRSAVDSGATCAQLWDIEKNFEDTADEKRVVSDLKEIGCRTGQSTRTDQNTEGREA
jgi:hypothetical protein